MTPVSSPEHCARRVFLPGDFYEYENSVSGVQLARIVMHDSGASTMSALCAEIGAISTRVRPTQSMSVWRL